MLAFRNQCKCSLFQRGPGATLRGWWLSGVKHPFQSSYSLFLTVECQLMLSAVVAFLGVFFCGIAPRNSVHRQRAAKKTEEKKKRGQEHLTVLKQSAAAITEDTGQHMPDSRLNGKELILLQYSVIARWHWMFAHLTFPPTFAPTFPTHRSSAFLDGEQVRWSSALLPGHFKRLNTLWGRQMWVWTCWQGPDKSVYILAPATTVWSTIKG